MNNLSYLKDKDFLRKLDNDNNKFYWVKIEVLDAEERTISAIQGKVQSGSSINIDGNSSVRRTCNISFIAEEAENDLTNVDNLLSVNKKIRIMEGIENTINENYDPIIWFPQGIYVIVQPSINHSSNGCIINLSCKDKMCLLNGECGGNLPTSITFDSYDQIIGEVVCQGHPANDSTIIPNNYTIYYDKTNNIYYSQTKESGQKKEKNGSAIGTRVSVKQRIYDIIRTLVCNYGGESLSKIFINDVPLDLKQIVRQTGSEPLYYKTEGSVYTTDESKKINDEQITFEYGDDIGYVYTDFTYPGSLVSSIGENVCSVLDKIKATLGNYEYFYDTEGNFYFQQIRNYLNNSYDPVNTFRLDNHGKIRKVETTSNGLCILDNLNYEVDFHNGNKTVYSFVEGSGLITSYNNNPSYTNLKNDYHIQGKTSDGYAIHYHLAIKEKPLESDFKTYNVIFLKNNKGESAGIRLANDDEAGAISYKPSDQRAELYLRGLTKQKNQIRPDVYEQELLDLFDSIYDFQVEQKDKDNNIIYGAFKTDMAYNPNALKYFFDYLEPIDKMADCSVDLIGTRIQSYQQDKIRKLYNTDIPNVIIIDMGMDSKSRTELQNRCDAEGQPRANVTSEIYSKIAIGTIGYTAQETMRDLLYQHTNYNESISIQSIPIYYLDVNNRISVYDKKSGIYGDYIIKSISLPLNAEGTMSISAIKALDRI